MDGMSFNDAVELWFRAYTEFNPKVYKVIEYILKHTKGHCKCLLNRNPENCGTYESDFILQTMLIAGKSFSDKRKSAA